MKVFKYLFISSIMFAVTSCGNDWLDLAPSTQVDTETSINVLSDIEFTLNGIYSTMQSSDAYSGRLVYYGDVTGDDMQAVSSTKRTGNYYRFNFTKDNGPSSHWSYLYSIIQNCNLILMNVDKLSIDEDETEYKNDLKGQALAIRGMALFDLTRIFGYPYLKDNGASLGVPIVKELSTIDSKPARNTVAECYTEIISDLKNSTELLSGDFNKGKVNRWAAMTLLSRVYLYKGEYNEALTMAENAIKGAEKEGYALWTNEEYPTAWGNDASASNPGEILFEIVNLTTDSPGKESMGYLNSYNGYDDMCITCSFYQLLKKDPKDVRLKILSFDKKYYAYVNKYQPQQGENITDANIPLIRLSEAYLNAAEAAVQTGDNAKAVKYLNSIVQRANPENSVEGKTLTLENVLDERRKELVAEGHRMYDVIRNGMTVKRIDVKDSDINKTLDFKDKKKDKEKKEELTADGPYVLYQPDGQIRVINVDKKGNIIDTTYTTLPQNFTLHVTDHKGRFPFDVKLHPVKRPGWNYPQADKVFVMSDPHGRLDCVISLLQGNHIIDKDYKWSFGKNHLMIIGDIFDRGKDVPQIFWLFYKLEEEAAKAGGHVSFILGNHEPMVLANDLRYTKEKYKILAEKLKMEYPRLFGPDTELGRWLGTRNTMQMIGNDLYVHAGLGKDFYDKNLSIPTVNEEMSKGLFMTKKERKALSPLTAFLYGNSGPIWYRGLVRTDGKYNPLAKDSLEMIMDRYKAKHIIVGHTIFKDISTFYNGKVIGVNVDNKENRKKKRGRAMLIKNNQYFVVGDKGIQRQLE